jgi:hypothetical protein
VRRLKPAAGKPLQPLAFTNPFYKSNPHASSAAACPPLVLISTRIRSLAPGTDLFLATSLVMFALRRGRSLFQVTIFQH